MSFFRINIYLKIKLYIFSLFLGKKNLSNSIEKLIKKNTKKKYFILTSQLRVGFILLLEFLRKKYPKKNEIIFSPYNLEEMINIATNLKYKTKFCDLIEKNGFFSIKELNKKINKKTLAVVLTNMFNSRKDSLALKKLCKRRKIILIEDNAIYFDNYSAIKNKKIYAGSIGDYSLNSFNIMKNISALYGGGVATNNINFLNYSNKRLNSFIKFPKKFLLKQSIIYFLLKILSINFFYKILFLKIVRYAHLNNNLILLKLFYPSLKFKKKKFPNFYFSKISNLSKKMIYLQLIDEESRKENHDIRKKKNIYYQKLIKDEKIKQINIFPINDNNFQNFTDFPIITKNKDKLNRFLLKNGIETKVLHYKNCAKTFKYGTNSCKTADKFEKSILCLPNHHKITEEYMSYIINKISSFYSGKK